MKEHKIITRSEVVPGPINKIFCKFIQKLYSSEICLKILNNLLIT